MSAVAFETGQSNYTEERKELFKDITMDEMLNDIRKLEAEKKQRMEYFYRVN